MADTPLPPIDHDAVASGTPGELKSDIGISKSTPPEGTLMLSVVLIRDTSLFDKALIVLVAILFLVAD